MVSREKRSVSRKLFLSRTRFGTRDNSVKSVSRNSHDRSVREQFTLFMARRHVGNMAADFRSQLVDGACGGDVQRPVV
jgi:hypothetical protein